VVGLAVTAVITPHARCLPPTQTDPIEARLAIGTAMSVELGCPKTSALPAMVDKVAAAVKAAMKDAGISGSEGRSITFRQNAVADHRRVLDAEKRGHDWRARFDSMGVSNGTTALRHRRRAREIKMPLAEQICKDLDLYSSVASCSSGVELTQAQIVLLGNKPAPAPLPYRHAVMRDRARHGWHLRCDPQRRPRAARASALDGPWRQGRQLLHEVRGRQARHVRGRRQINARRFRCAPPRHSKASVGGVAAAALGDSAVFVSVDAMHQGRMAADPSSPLLMSASEGWRHEPCF